MMTEMMARDGSARAVVEWRIDEPVRGEALVDFDARSVHVMFDGGDAELLGVGGFLYLRNAATLLPGTTGDEWVEVTWGTSGVYALADLPRAQTLRPWADDEGPPLTLAQLEFAVWLFEFMDALAYIEGVDVEGPWHLRTEIGDNAAGDFVRFLGRHPVLDVWAERGDEHRLTVRRFRARGASGEVSVELSPWNGRVAEPEAYEWVLIEDL
jgi:hypothetical protein